MSPADSPFAPLPAPGPHPAPAELRAYAAGTLATASEHHIEAHTLDCERCADLVAGFSMSDAATTDRAVAELRTRLQARLATEAPPVVAGGWAWPRLAAAAALVAAVGGGIWTLEQRETTPAPAPQETAAVAPPAAAPAEIASPPAPPAASSTADYAVVMPPPPVRRELSANAPPSANAEVADYAALSDKMVESATISSPQGEASAAIEPAADAPATSAPVVVGAPGYGKMDGAPARSAEGSVAGRVSSDSTFPSTAMALARKSVQAKAKAATADAPASVPNTAMPAGPMLNPAPVGGTPALRDYLRREASQFIPEINNLRISGTVHLRFTVEADGKLSNIKVTREVRDDYDEEALRLLCEGPAWQPGIVGGKRAPVVMEVTVPF